MNRSNMESTGEEHEEETCRSGVNLSIFDLFNWDMRNCIKYLNFHFRGNYFIHWVFLQDHFGRWKLWNQPPRRCRWKHFYYKNHNRSVSHSLHFKLWFNHNISLRKHKISTSIFGLVSSVNILVYLKVTFQQKCPPWPPGNAVHIAAGCLRII